MRKSFLLGKLWLLLSVGLGILLFSSLSVLALQETEIVVVPLDNEIKTNEQALFEVTITNNAGQRQTYTLYGLDVVWGVDPADKKFTLQPGSSKTTMVKVTPLGPFKPSSYTVKLYVDVSTSEDRTPHIRYKKDLLVILYPEEPYDYLPSIKVTADMDEKINPQSPVSIKLFMENRNPLDLGGMKIRIESDVPEFAQQAVIDLPPMGKKTVEFSITPNPFQQPKQYTLFFVFEHKEQPVKVLERKIEIIPLTPAFEVTTAEDSYFLRTVTRLTVRNGGNVLNTQEVTVPIAAWRSLFSRSDGKLLVQESGRSLQWTLSLNPDEHRELTIFTSYRILFYLALLGLLFVLFYWYVRSPVIVRKTVFAAKSDEDGAISEIKITLEIKNTSRQLLKNVEVVDIVPGIANVEKGLEVGTIKPLEIKHTRKGTKVVWVLPELDQYEHRLINYRVKAKLNILGTFSLPRASAAYQRKSGRKGKAYSNIFRLTN